MVEKLLTLGFHHRSRTLPGMTRFGGAHPPKNPQPPNAASLLPQNSLKRHFVLDAPAAGWKSTRSPVFSISRANSFRGFRSKMCMHACLLINPDCALCRLVPLTPLAMVEPISPHASRRSCAHPPGETHILPFEQG